MKKSIVGISLLSLALSVPVASAENAESFIDQIIVTAEKREENVLEVPITMTAFNDKLIEELGMTNQDDLEQLVPGLQFGDSGQQVGQGTVIRGIGSRLTGETHSDLAVATYVNGIYTLGAYGVAPNMFDLERVEVARGPQGTLNGRNSIAGSISYFFKKPTDEWDLLIHTEHTDQFTQRYGIAWGGPLGDIVSFRLNGSSYDGDGAQENLGPGGDYDAPDQVYFAPQIRFKTERMDLNLRYSKLDDEGSPRTQVLLTNFDRSMPTINGSTNAWYLWDEPLPSVPANCPPGRPAWECGDIDNVINVNRPGEGGSNAESMSAQFRFDINEQFQIRYSYGDTDNFSTVTRDRDMTARVASANDPFTAADADVPLVDSDIRVLFFYEEESHELQLVSNMDGPLNFIVGYFQYENATNWRVPVFTHTNSWTNQTFDEAAIAAGFAGGCADVVATLQSFGISTTPEEAIANDEPGNFWQCAPGNDHTQTLDFGTTASSETEAFFVNAEYRLNDNWVISGGLRATEDTKNQGENGGWFKGAFGFIGGAPIEIVFDDSDPDTRSWDKTIGHISLEHTNDNGQLLYGRLSTGYRAGGFNTKSDAFPSFIKEETLLNYEVGYKGLFMNDKLVLTSGLFYNDFDDYQITGQIDNPNLTPDPFAPSPVVEFTDNIQDTTIWGGEVDFMYYVNENWRLSGFYAYLDSEIGPHFEVVRGHPNPETGTYEHLDFDTGMLTTSEYTLPTDMTGNQLPMQPNHKFAITATYETALTGGANLQVLGTYSWVGDRFSDLSNFDISTLPSYGRFDLRSTLTNPSETLAATFFIQNVFDEIGLVEFLLESTNSAAPASGTLTQPRQVGVEFRWRPNL
ncbi:MAG: TonB-dependent receptor [Pseudomonadota bacterium]